MSWLDYEGLSYYSEQLLPTIDGKAVEKNYSATLMASGWSSTVPYTQTVTVLGLAADDKPILDVDTSGATTATALANLNAAWLNTIKAVASNGLLTVTVSSAPTIDLPIKIKVFHGINTGGASSDEEFMEAVQGALKELDNNKLNKSALLNAVYPVGSIYMSVNSASPATLFGGTWERLKDRFLLAAGDTYAAGAAGGEASHALVYAEMPSHHHGVKIMYNQTGFGQNASQYELYIKKVDGSTFFGSSEATPEDYTNLNVRNLRPTTAAGSSQPHNNMPPYLAVYIWKRTA